MRLALNAYLLWRGLYPDQAISKETKQNATFFLFTGEKREQLSGNEINLLRAATSNDTVVALLERETDVPEWQLFVRVLLDLPGFGGATDSLGAIIFCPVPTQDKNGTELLRWVAWCFGSGSRSLRRAATEPRFGLIAALNAIVETRQSNSGMSETPSTLRRVGLKTTAPYHQEAGFRAAHDIPIDAFRIDRLTDLIASAGGATSDPVLGDVLGSKSLSFTSSVDDLVDLRTASASVYSRAQQENYRDGFSWVDNTSPVLEDALIQQLRLKLFDAVTADPVAASVDVLLADDLITTDLGRRIKYILLPGEYKSKAARTTLPLADIRRVLNADGPGGLDQDLRFLDDSGEEIGSPRIIECLSAELIVDGSQYVISDGTFYKVDRSFVSRIDNEVSNIAKSAIQLPCHNGQKEGEYNQFAQQVDDDLYLLDRKLITLPGETQIEACDLIHKSGALIHVKRKGRSSTLSHLFFQAENSCRMFRGSPVFRERFDELVNATAASGLAKPRPLPEMELLPTGPGPEVVFALLGLWTGKTALNLPLFSRIGLVQACQRIGELGYKPTLQLVDVCP